ncbi:MAG: glycosyltransferase family 2 protein [Flavobacteriaceae bacterium]|nr:glycosyltransferase family 2 protein [Flavobacteriaceae bacterium]
MISVIIPVYNSDSTLERSVLSIVKEPLVAEIIIVDDGSTDNSNFIANSFANKYPFIKIFHHGKFKNKGATASRNLGLVNAISDWIQFLDADDELLPGKIERQFSKVNSEMSFIVGNAIDCFEDGHEHFRKFISDPWAGLIAGKLGITSANLWNKEALLEIGGWNESLSSSQEYELMFRLLKKYEKIGFCDLPLTRIYKRKNSISNNPLIQSQRVNNWLNLRKDIKLHLKEINKFNIQRNYIYSGYLLDFCQRNNCLDSFDGDLFLGKLFQVEKKLKQKVHTLGKNLSGSTN